MEVEVVVEVVGMVAEGEGEAVEGEAVEGMVVEVAAEDMVAGDMVAGDMVAEDMAEVIMEEGAEAAGVVTMITLGIIPGFYLAEAVIVKPDVDM
jgi:hypothetical protein